MQMKKWSLQVCLLIFCELSLLVFTIFVFVYCVFDWQIGLQSRKWCVKYHSAGYFSYCHIAFCYLCAQRYLQMLFQTKRVRFSCLGCDIVHLFKYILQNIFVGDYAKQTGRAHTDECGVSCSGGLVSQLVGQSG